MGFLPTDIIVCHLSFVLRGYVWNNLVSNLLFLILVLTTQPDPTYFVPNLVPTCILFNALLFLEIDVIGSVLHVTVKRNIGA